MDYPKYRWYALITLIAATLAQGMSLISPTPLVGEISKTLQVELGAATAVAMLPFTLLVAIGGMVSGMIIDRWGIAKTYVAFCLLETIASALMTQMGSSVAELAILRTMQGFGYFRRYGVCCCRVGCTSRHRHVRYVHSYRCGDCDDRRHGRNLDETTQIRQLNEKSI